MTTCKATVLVSFLHLPLIFGQTAGMDRGDLVNLQGTIQMVAKEKRAVTVSLRVQAGGGAGEASGSGVLVSSDGLILTAAHVVEGIGRHPVHVFFDDGEERIGDVLGYNRSTDAGMVQLRDKGPWPHVELGQSISLQPGDWTIAIGHPEGYDEIRRAPVRFGRVIANASKSDFFNTDCVLIGGDSGGPLFDLEGRLIGIHSSIGKSRESNSHVRIEAFEKDWEAMLAGKRSGVLSNMPMNRPGAPLLGVVFARGYNALVINEVIPNSGASEAGLQRGDIILAIKGHPVQSFEPLRYHLAENHPGDEVALLLQRNGTRIEKKVILGARDEPYQLTRKLRKKLEERTKNYFKAFEQITKPLGSGSIEIFPGILPTPPSDSLIGYGTIVPGNRILTKWSRLPKGPCLGYDSSGEGFLLELAGTYPDYDLAVLTPPEGRTLTPTPWAKNTPALGQLLAAVRPDGRAQAIGTVSVEEHSELENDQGFLGIRFDTYQRSDNLIVTEVEPGSPAQRAGLKVYDVLTKVNGKKLDGSQELITRLKRISPGSTVNITYLREGKAHNAEVVLARRPNFPDSTPSRRLYEMNAFDGLGLSRIAGPFPQVLQTDHFITPSDCGLPVVNLEGKLAGMIIARAGRIKTSVLSASTLEKLLNTAPHPAQPHPLAMRKKPKRGASTWFEYLQAPPSYGNTPSDPLFDLLIERLGSILEPSPYGYQHLEDE